MHYGQPKSTPPEPDILEDVETDPLSPERESIFVPDRSVPMNDNHGRHIVDPKSTDIARDIDLRRYANAIDAGNAGHGFVLRYIVPNPAS